MTVARSRLVDPAVTRVYHCVSRCVRRARLLGDGALTDRKQWIENRLQELSGIFAISVAGFAILDNHLHVIVRLEPECVDAWTDEEVVLRWARLFPPPGLARVDQTWIQARLNNSEWIATARTRLASLSWFMKCLKEPLSRMANREDETRGTFFESRFKSTAILDEAAAVATCVYVDLNPLAAGIADRPETSSHTSIKSRIDHLRAAGLLAQVIDQPSVPVAPEAPARAPGDRPETRDPEAAHWLCPLEDRSRSGAKRAGLFANLTLTEYLKVLDASSRLLRAGKASVSTEVAGILERLRTTPDQWRKQFARLGSARWFGHCFSTSRELLRRAAARLGQSRVGNVAGSPVG